MGFSIFGKKDNDSSRNGLEWNVMSAPSDLTEILARSSEKTQLIFKHSTTCGISRIVLREFETEWNSDEVEIHYLDLIALRPISNAIAGELQVTHQSPQVILIKEGSSIAEWSHQAIDAKKIADFAVNG